MTWVGKKIMITKPLNVYKWFGVVRLVTGTELTVDDFRPEENEMRATLAGMDYLFVVPSENYRLKEAE